MQRLTLIRPDDWHVHLRDGPALAAVVRHSAERFGRAVVMPNLKPPVCTVADALAYRDRIRQALPAGSRFEPLMTLYLTDHTSPDEITRAADTPGMLGAKLYPAGATTHSDAGVTSVARIAPVLAAMQRHDLVLQVHGEVTDPEVDVFDREARFIETVLAPLLGDFPALRVVFEHITTRAAVAFVRAGPPTLAATITAHHLLENRNAMFRGGIRPHHYCLPVLKREADRRALVEAASSGEPCFFLGTDSAPHARHAKEAACGCAGIYTAHAGIELYAEVFDAAGALDRLEGFASRNGPSFYRLPVNEDRITLTRDPWRVPMGYRMGDGELVPFRAGEAVGWRMGQPVRDQDGGALCSAK